MKRLPDVPSRKYDVVLVRAQPTRLQSRYLVVASYNKRSDALENVRNRRANDPKNDYEVR